MLACPILKFASLSFIIWTLKKFRLWRNFVVGRNFVVELVLFFYSRIFSWSSQDGILFLSWRYEKVHTGMKFQSGYFLIGMSKFTICIEKLIPRRILSRYRNVLVMVPFQKYPKFIFNSDKNHAKKNLWTLRI